MKDKKTLVLFLVHMALFHINGMAQSFNSAQTNPFSLTYITPYNSSPTFGDLDGDGDLDMLSGGSNGGFYYFKNSGSATSPSFNSPQSNPFSLTYITPTLSAPSLGDLDNDGDLDIMCGGSDGLFYYFKNSGSSSSPSFNSPQANPFSLTYISPYKSTPVFVDLDNDGDLDIMSGGSNGSFYYFKNSGSASSPSFNSPQTNPFGLTYITPYDSDPAFADLDGDGDKDMLVGASNGGFYYFKNAGNASSPSFNSPQTNPFNLNYITPYSSTPAFGDLDGDGDKDLLSGGSNGGFYYFKNSTPIGLREFSIDDAKLSVYPNPSKGNFTIFLENETTMNVEVKDALGQTVYEQTMEGNTCKIDLSSQSKGIYFLTINGSNAIYRRRIVVQ